MSEKSRAFIEKNLPELAHAAHPNDILDPLDDLIVLKGFEKGRNSYNARGEEAQEVYDDIFDSNFDD
jgi:hypothetical protein